MPILRVRKGAQTGSQYPVSSSHIATVLGREGHAHVGLNDARSSRKHAQVRLEAGQWVLEDLQSSNGTFLQGQRIEKAVLEDGSTFQIGNTLLGFHEHELPPLPRPEIHGVRLVATLGELAGVHSFRGQQTALDREVRCDWVDLKPLAGGSLSSRLERAIEESQKLEDAGILPVLAAEVRDNEAFVILKGAPANLEEKLGEVLRMPLDLRIQIFRQLLDLALERATWEALRSPIALRHIGLPANSVTAGPEVLLPALELSSIVAEEIGDCRHHRAFAPYLPPELSTDGDTRSSTSPLASTLYNVGAIGYHLLTGQEPMGKGLVTTILENHRTLRAAPASLVNPEVPEAISTLLDQMLEKSPSRRPGGRLEAMRAFENMPRSIASHSTPPQPPIATPQPASVRGRSTVTPRPPAEPQPRPAMPSPPAARAPTQPAAPASPPKPAAATQPRRASPQTKSKFSGIVFLPLWVLLWIVCFYAARILSKLVFESLGA